MCGRECGWAQVPADLGEIRDLGKAGGRARRETGWPWGLWEELAAQMRSMTMPRSRRVELGGAENLAGQGRGGTSWFYGFPGGRRRATWWLAQGCENTYVTPFAGLRGSLGARLGGMTISSSADANVEAWLLIPARQPIGVSPLHPKSVYARLSWALLMDDIRPYTHQPPATDC